MESQPDRVRQARKLCQEAEDHFHEENFEASRHSFRLLLERYSDLVCVPEINMWIGACEYWLGSFESALRFLVHSSHEAEKLTNKPFIVHSFEYLARVHRAMGQPERAFECMEQAESYFHLWEGEGNWRARSEFRLLKGRLLLQLARFDSALAELMDAREQVPVKERTKQVDALFAYEIGRTYHYLGDQTRASELLQGISPNNFGDQDLLPDYHYIMARLGVTVGHYDSTIKHFEVLRSLDVSERDLAEALHYAGVAYMHLGNRHEAIECFRASQRSDHKSDALREANAAHLARLLSQK